MRICQFQSFLSADSELGTNHRFRVHSILLLVRSPTRDVVFSTLYSSGGCVFDALVAPDCTFCNERTNCGFDHGIHCWDDDLPVAICFLSVSGYNHVFLD